VKDDLETYGAILAELARGADRADVLAQHGLDEERFEALEDRALALLSAEEGDGVPEAVVRFDRAIRGGPAAARALPSLEAFAQAYLIAQEGGNVAERLKERGSSLEVLLQGSEHYVPRFAKEPELLDRFLALTSRSGPTKKS
jgi:hypothetical protein